MTTYPYTSSPSGPFQFSPNLDGTQYQAVITNNLFGQRLYLNLYATNGALIVCLPVIESTASIPLASLSWDINSGLVSGTTSAPLVSGTATVIPGNIGATINLTISGVTPDAYNGTFPCFVRGPNQFTYALASDPGAAMVLGSVGYQINIIGGYFTTSTLIFVNGSFVVSP